MSTARQIAANCANATKSTGPVTPEGKANSSRNRFSHGFTASTSYIQDVEDPEDFHGLIASLQREYRPATTTEQILVEKMFHNQMLSLRAIRLQTACLRGLQPGQEVPKDLGLLIRYQHASDRAFHKAHAELLKAQKERKMSEIGFESSKAPEAAATPAGSSQNEPRASENPAEQEIKRSFIPDVIPMVAKMAAGAAKLPQAA